MHLGLDGKSAIVCAASKGLGKACALQLAKEGVNLTICARTESTLLETQKEIEGESDVKVTSIACDITSAEGRSDVLAANPNPDILINNAGGPAPGNFRDWDRDTWVKALDANMLTPIELIKAVVDGMMERQFGRIVNITSGAVKAPIDVLGLSNGARTGLTGFIAGVSRTTVSHNVTINNLLPGPFDTDRIAQVVNAQAKAQGIDFEEAKKLRMGENPAKRFGKPEEFGAMCAFMCSEQAAFMTGQNILLDGGAYPGVF